MKSGGCLEGGVKKMKIMYEKWWVSRRCCLKNEEHVWKVGGHFPISAGFCIKCLDNVAILFNNLMITL